MKFIMISGVIEPQRFGDGDAFTSLWRTSSGITALPRFAWTSLRVLLNNTLHNRIGSARVESDLRYFLSFCNRVSTRFEIHLNKSSKLQTS
jgi:hypothetical protein